MAKDGSETFRLDSAMKERLRKTAFQCDRTKSELICACLSFAMPFFEADHSLVDITDTMERLRSKTSAR